MGRQAEYFFRLGRERRLNLEGAIVEGRANTADAHRIPRMSHDGTLQSAFERGWRSPSIVDLHEASGRTLVSTLMAAAKGDTAMRIAHLRSLFEPKEAACPSR